MNTPDESQSLTLFEALIPVVSLILLIALSFFLFGNTGADGQTQMALVISAMIAVAWRRRHSLISLHTAASESVSSGISAIFILLAIGALVGTWALSATLIAMVYCGMQLLSPTYFYMTPAAICALVSFCMDSSWTVVGTIGIGLMGIALNIDMDPAITAGAVISAPISAIRCRPVSRQYSRHCLPLRNSNPANGCHGLCWSQHLTVFLLAATWNRSSPARLWQFHHWQSLWQCFSAFHLGPFGRLHRSADPDRLNSLLCRGPVQPLDRAAAISELLG